MKPLGFTLAELKELSDSLDVLASDGALEVSRTTAVQVFQECRARADATTEKLRQHLAYTEELSELLDHLAEDAQP